MYRFLAILFLGLLISGKALGSKNNVGPIVDIKPGRIQGYIDTNSNGATFYGFRAIPFAKPPIRFKPPEPVDHWDGIFDGSKMGEICSQFDQMSRKIIGIEDCLQLNVYTTNLNDDANNPVIVNIHGGGFVVGSGGYLHNGPHHLMNYPIVFVSFNYRLGVLGFLSTQDEHAYGNYGMLDQVLALKWVQENIKQFGGDPNRVTIIGNSAGAGSVSLHLFSHLSTGLFHKAIIQSGSPIETWSANKNPLINAKRLSREVGCPHENTEALVQCLTEKTPEELNLADRRMRGAALFFPVTLNPTVEVAGGPGFLVEEPELMLSEGRIVNRVPVIMGIAQLEGYNVYFDFVKAFKSRGRAFFENELYQTLQICTKTSPNEKLVVDAVTERYLKNLNVEDEDVFIDVVSQIISDACLAAGVAKTAELFSQNGIDFYAYIFNHLGQYCFAMFDGGKCGKVCSHADELFLLYQIGMLKLKTKDDIEMSKIITRLWTSFANDSGLVIGNEINWPTYDTSNKRFIELSVTPNIKRGLLTDSMAFWRETIPNLGLNDKPKDEL